MRRRLNGVSCAVLHPLRHSCTVAALVKAQAALARGTAPSAAVAAEFAKFFHVPVSPDAGVARSAQDHYARLRVLAAEPGAAEAPRHGRPAVDGSHRGGPPLFLAAFAAPSATLHIFSVAADDVVCSVSTDLDEGQAWGVADELLAHTGGSPQLVLVPVVDTEEERTRLVEPLKRLVGLLKTCGLQVVFHVDTLELCSTLSRSPPPPPPPPPRTVTRGGAAMRQWLQAHWARLRTAACLASPADPLETVGALVLPRYDVYVVHLVRAGSRGLNVSLWDPVRRRRFSAKGMISDVLACLLDTRSRDMILVPTNRTDRAALFRCRTAVSKSGRRCAVVYASEVSERLRGCYQSDPMRYWGTLRDAAVLPDSDLLFGIYVAAGNTWRGYERKRLSESGARGAAPPATGAASSTEAGAAAAEEVVSPQSATDWGRYFTLPQRVAAESAELRHYDTFITVSYVATDHTLHAQPRNPLAEGNHVLSACITDHAGRTVEPWATYARRGQFCLPCLDGYKVLVTHDAKSLLLLLSGDAELRKFIRRGGRVWCVTLAEYLLEGQRCRTGGNSVHDLALRHGMQLPVFERVGTPNDRLPFSVLRSFLLGAAPAVSRVFAAQLKRAVEQCQMLSLAHRMDTLLAMASMEEAGIHIDAEEAARQTASLKSAAAVLDTAMEAYVPAEVPLDMRSRFDWSSLQHQRAYFFGGAIQLGQPTTARDSPLWTSNVVHLCHRFGAFATLTGELHLQRYAAQLALPPVGSVPQRISQHIEAQGSQKTKTYRLVLFDVETTGLNTGTDAMIEVAMYDPVEDSSFHTLINPQRPITPRTIRIHNITNEMVRGAPTMDVVAKSIGQYLRLDPASYDPNEILVLVGHNVFTLDEPMLRRALECHAPECQLDGVLFCDSLALINVLRTDLRLQPRANRTSSAIAEALSVSLSLTTLITALKVRPDGEMHRADTDTRALWHVLVHVFSLTGKDAVTQRSKLFYEVANCFLRAPSVGCLVPTQRQSPLVTVRLPGVAKTYIESAKTVASLEKKDFSDTVLVALEAHGVKPAGLLLQRQLLDRHTSRFLQPGTQGRLALLHPDGRVHQHIDMTATTTSRTTSAYPSCQNVPKDDKSSARRLFVSRFGAEGRCIEVDYAQLEIIVLAVLCGDANLTNDLNSGVDFHVRRAAFFSGLPYEEIYEGYTRGVPKYVQLRKTAKRFSFQRLYGAGVPLLHKTTGIAVADLEASIRKENEAYPGIAHFHHVMRSVALRPCNPGLPTGFIVEMPTGLRMSLRARDAVLNLPPMKNYPIQGYGAELAQMMLGRLFRHFVRKDFYDGRAFLINFVHDAVWIDCHVDALQECVTDACRILGSAHEYVPKVFPGVAVPVPLRVSAACGVDMASMDAVTGDNFSVVATQRKAPPTDVRDFLNLTTAKPSFFDVMEESSDAAEESTAEDGGEEATATR
ncbi:mitochondrial DNA polymerase I protein B [Novymonas esmeraldas]|uniref:Mitochondrial DNA polymerase I protein B n=1 Tax=Novymonas esmeraldas TaxID=1808958 RepID=A0AAW0EXQ2_9TRYP